jgi:hypothetical protein
LIDSHAEKPTFASDSVSEDNPGLAKKVLKAGGFISKAHSRMTEAYTLATYRVRPGMEQDFIHAWEELAATFSTLENPPYWGVLIRSMNDPRLFHSFGPWEDASDVTTMRADPDAQSAFKKLAASCLEMTPGNYELIKRVRVRDEPSG